MTEPTQTAPLFIRATPALRRMLRTVVDQERAAHPERKITEAEIVRHVLYAGLRARIVSRDTPLAPR